MVLTQDRSLELLTAKKALRHYAVNSGLLASRVTMSSVTEGGKAFQGLRFIEPSAISNRRLCRLLSAGHKCFVQPLCDLVDRVAEFDDALQIVSSERAKIVVINGAKAEHGVG